MSNQKPPSEYLALALDNCAERKQIQRLVYYTAPSIGTFKIGLEQYTRFGPSILQPLKESGRKIFLDLKLHDIPNTVAKAVEAAAEKQIDLLTIHCTGGSAMMKAAAAAARRARDRGLNPPRLIGVTVLTSISESMLGDELAVGRPLSDYTAHLAELAAVSGLDGIVCSAVELPQIRPCLPEHFEIITPGIRLKSSAADDQQRIATPQEAVRNGATLLVIGRIVTTAEEPGRAAAQIAESLS
jgi:orotidine-5'-phosphate decarboxylase